MQGCLAKQLSTDSPDNDIEIKFAANEGAPVAHDSLPAILGHMPQLAEEPEEAGSESTDADTDREPDLADDQENLLSPIPDLPMLQAKTAPSKVQPTAKPAAAPLLTALTTDKRSGVIVLVHCGLFFMNTTGVPRQCFHAESQAHAQ